MVDWLFDDTHHTVDTIQKGQVDGSALLSTRNLPFKKYVYKTATSAILKYTKMYNDICRRTNTVIY